MNRSTPSLVVAVVPDSGTEELVRLEGEFTINIEAGIFENRQNRSSRVSNQETLILYQLMVTTHRENTQPLIGRQRQQVRVIGDQVVDAGSESCLENRTVVRIVRYVMPRRSMFDQYRSAEETLPREETKTGRALESLDQDPLELFGDMPICENAPGTFDGSCDKPLRASAEQRLRYVDVGIEEDLHEA